VYSAVGNMASEKVKMSTTLEEIKNRATTVGDVDVKVDMLLKDLEASTESVVLKKLIREQVSNEADAKKWKKHAILGIGISTVLLACVFGLSILSTILAKDVHVEDGTAGKLPIMTDDQGRALATAGATQLYGLQNAPALPPGMLATVTEITFNIGQNTSISVDITARTKSLDGVLFQTTQGTFLLVLNNVKAAFFIDNKINKKEQNLFKEFPPDVKETLLSYYKDEASVHATFICGNVKCARFSSRDPTEEELEQTMNKRRLSIARGALSERRLGNFGWYCF